jgi:hypothetical protein
MFIFQICSPFFLPTFAFIDAAQTARVWSYEHCSFLSENFEAHMKHLSDSCGKNNIFQLTIVDIYSCLKQAGIVNINYK